MTDAELRARMKAYVMVRKATGEILKGKRRKTEQPELLDQLEALRARLRRCAP